jgi:hypothetical protein
LGAECLVLEGFLAPVTDGTDIANNCIRMNVPYGQSNFKTRKEEKMKKSFEKKQPKKKAQPKEALKKQKVIKSSSSRRGG